MFDFINVAFGWLMRQCYNLIDSLGFGGYALALFLFALACQIVLFPFAVKQQKNMQKQARLRPKENVIRKKYNGRSDRNSQMKMNEEIQQLYAEEHYSPLSGCLPLLIQLPILFSLFYVIRDPLTYISGLGEDIILEIYNFLAENGVGAFQVAEKLPHNTEITLLNHLNSNTAGVATHFADALAGHTIPSFKLGPIDLSLKPGVAFDNFKQYWSLLLIPVATFLSAFFGQKITRKFSYQAPNNPESASSMKLMNVMMPLFSAYLAYMWEASMGLYWTYRSILSFLQQMLLSVMFPLPKFTEEEMRAEEKEYMAKLRGRTTYKPEAPSAQQRKSLIFDDDENDEEQTPTVQNSIIDD